MVNKLIACIDHSFHKKTQSSNFFIKLLNERYEVDIYYDTYWSDKNVFDFDSLNDKEYGTIIFWQINYSIKYLKKLKCKNIIYIPMYDDFISNTITPFYWRQFSSVKFISFSESLHEYLVSKNQNSFHIKYFPKLKNEVLNIDFKKLTAFFWYRIDSINWNIIKKLINENDFNAIYIQNNPDSYNQKLKISREDIKKYDIKFIDWFESKDVYIDFLKSIDVYFAPREYEGIGLSFLEAMSYGKYIISIDNPTMNEYIVHGRNGFLYQKDICKKINFNNVQIDDINKLNSIHYNEYCNKLDSMFSFIELSNDIKSKKNDYFYFLCDRYLRLPFRVFRKLFK